MATEIPATMKAAVVTKLGGPLEVKEVPTPQPQEGQILVRTMASGVCHSDVHLADNDWKIDMDVPRILGHEGVGYVAKLGPGVTNLKVGDRVGVPVPWKTCEDCPECREGWNVVCPQLEITGKSKDGGYSQYILANAAYVGKIPEGLSYEQAAPIMCAGLTTYKALKVSEVKPGQWVVITGAAGGLGHVACQYAKAMGMKVIAVSRSITPEKAAMFKEYSVDYSLDLSKEKVTDGVMKATGGRGADGVICITPRMEDVSDAADYIARRGTIVTVGLDAAAFKITPFQLVMKAAKIVGSHVGNKSDLLEAFDFAAAGKVKCHVTPRKLEDVNKIFDDIRQNKFQGRFVMDMAAVQ